MRYLYPLLLLAGLTAIKPDMLAAQTSGVGCDGYTRLFWRGSDSRMSLWRLDPSLLSQTAILYGPYDGWTPVAMTVLCNNYSYVLWKHTSGAASLWKVDPNLNYVTSHMYGPFAGWIPESLSPDHSYAGSLRLLWTETLGQVSIWAMDSNANFIFSQDWRTDFGYEPHALAAHHAVDGSSTPSDQAAADMKVKDGSATPMPQQ